MTISFPNGFPVDFTPDVMQSPNFETFLERLDYCGRRYQISQHFLTTDCSAYSTTIDHCVLSPKNIQRLLGNITACGFKTESQVLGKKTKITVSFPESIPFEASERSASPEWHRSFDAREIMLNRAKESIKAPAVLQPDQNRDEEFAQKAYATIAAGIVASMREKPDVAKYDFNLRTSFSYPDGYKQVIGESLVEELKRNGFSANLVAPTSGMPVIEIFNPKANREIAAVPFFENIKELEDSGPLDEELVLQQEL